MLGTTRGDAHGAKTWGMLAAILALLAGSVPAAAQPASACPAPSAEWTMDDLLRVVQPMRHDLGGRLPLLLWNYPIAIGDNLLGYRAEGSLARWTRAAAQRGLALPVQIGWISTPAGALAQAQTVRELGLPLYLCVDELPGGNAGLYRNSKLWPLGPDLRRPHVRRWPCLPLTDAGQAAAGVRALMQEYRAAGLSPAGVFFEHEGFPHPWMGIYDAQRNDPRCAALYPPGTLDSETSFIQYVYALRSRVLSEAMADPVLAVFPPALVGNYDEWVSSKQIPYLANGGEALPPRTLGRLNMVTPRVYASPWYLHAYFCDVESVTPEQADPVYFNLLLNTLSTTNANQQPGQVSVPFVARDDPFDPLRKGDKPFGPGMSHAPYRELIRHALLRGTDGFYLYALGFPGSGVPTADAFGTIEDTRSVYDDLLAYREFLDQGQVMTYQTRDPHYRGPVWSGLRLKGQCLVRTFTMRDRPGRVRVEVFPGKQVELEAPREGATYLIGRDGVVQRVP